MAQQNHPSNEVWGNGIEDWFGMAFDVKETCINRLSGRAARGFFLLSAFTQNQSEAENVGATEQLSADLFAEGLKFRLVLLCREPNVPADTGATPQDLSLTLFVPFPEDYGSARFHNVAYSLARKYDQPQFTLCEPEDLAVAVWQRTEDVSKEYIPAKSVPFSPGNIERICAGPHGRVLGVRIPSNHISAMIMAQKGFLI